MKIYSWNMLFRNLAPDRAFEFISNAQFDVFCLQEVPPAFLERLRTLPYHVAFALDTERIERNVHHENYCVVLSPHPILTSSLIPLPLEERPTRTKLFQRLMWGLREIQRRGSVFCDIDAPGGRVRVFCLHLTLSYPARIQREFDLAMRLRNESVPTIVCGDFNVLESPHITVLNWFLGGRIRDVFFWLASRRAFAQRFAELGLQNPLRGTHTQQIALSQLDHILIPAGSRVLQKKACSDRVGSDHTPIFVEYE